MTLPVITNPFDTYIDLDGETLNGGEVFIGVAGMDPETNPQAVYWDAAGTIPATQPLETLDGYIFRLGSPARAYTAATYSMRVRDRSGNQVFYEPNVGPDTTLDLLTFIQAGTGAVSRTALSKMREIFSVEDFGAVGDGVTNDAPAFQLAANAIGALGRGKLVLGPKSYLLNAAVTFTNCDVMVEGDGQEATRLLVNNTTGGLFFSQANRAGTAYMSVVKDLTLVAHGAGDLLRGKAISFTYPNNSTTPGTASVAVQNVSVRSTGYTSAPGADPRFSVGFYIRNPHKVWIDQCSVVQIANTASIGVHFDYEAVSGAFGMTVSNCSIEGNQFGIRTNGWLENLEIINCEIAAPQYGVYADASALGFRTPLLTIIGGHINASNVGIYVNKWQSIQIDQPNVAAYADATTTFLTTYAARFDNCQYVEWTGGLVNSGAVGANGVSLISFQAGSSRINLSGIVGFGSFVAARTIRGVEIIGGSTKVRMTGCQIECTGGTGDSGVFVQTGNVTDDDIDVSANSLTGYTQGVYLINAYGARIKNNNLRGNTAPVTITGTVSGTTIIDGNYPATSPHATLTVNATTPSVGSLPDGRALVSSTGATTITNFTDGYDGMVLELRFTNGNTTIAHNATIFLQGSVNATFAASTLLRLRLDTSVGIWFEIGRRT